MDINFNSILGRIEFLEKENHRLNLQLIKEKEARKRWRKRWDEEVITSTKLRNELKEYKKIEANKLLIKWE